VRRRIDPAAMEITTRRRRAIATALALFLAVESVSAVAAAAVTTGVAAATARPAAAVTTPARVADPVRLAPQSAFTASASDIGRISMSPVVGTTLRPVVKVTPEQPVKPTLKATVKAVKAVKAKASARPSAKPARVYRGRNHVWIPALGISRSISWFPCSRSRPPDNYMYRWGCAGSNNVYLMGHAYSVMKPLHDAYVNGRLRTGMRAVYADARGKIHVFSVRWWKVVRPTTAASWAWASQKVSSMTLQTCVGKNSAYRLMVRLTEVRR
jgi:hypothetical protein